MLYNSEGKSIREVLPYLTTPLSLVIIFMDDGSVFKRKKRHKAGDIYYLRPSMKLCTHSFSKEDNELILGWMENVFGIKGYIVIERKKERNKEYYTLNFNSDNTLKIWKLIEQYVSQVPSMKEKFKFVYEFYSSK